MYDYTENKEKADKEERNPFPSVSLLVKLYTLGALASIVVGLALPLDTAQVTLCLAIGWLLTSISLFMSVFMELPTEDAEEDEL